MNVDSFEPDIPPGMVRNITVSMTMSQALTMGFRKELVLVVTGDRTESVPLYVTGKNVGIRVAAVFPASCGSSRVKVE